MPHKHGGSRHSNQQCYTVPACYKTYQDCRHVDEIPRSILLAFSTNVTMFSTPRGQQTLNGIFQKLLRQFIYCCSKVSGASIRKKQHVLFCRIVEILLFFFLLCAQNPPHFFNRRFDSAFLGLMQAQGKSFRANGKTKAV